MTKAQCRKLDSIVKRLQVACEQLGDLTSEVSLADYREGSNLSRAGSAVEGAIERFFAPARPV